MASLETSSRSEALFVLLQGFWNPMCVPATATGASVASVVPNDMTLGGEPPSDSAASGAAGTPRAMLLTGPNMGGKSTAMRCVAICAILAQSGCMVPASRCRMSAVSRIFVRMGAQDRLEAGSSTFHEECLDASLVLNEADQVMRRLHGHPSQFGRGWRGSPDVCKSMRTLTPSSSSVFAFLCNAAHAMLLACLLPSQCLNMISLRSSAFVVPARVSQDSLVILDELGRGTSTFDGHAIAHATLHDLVMRRGAARPRLLFSTHYHQLADEFGRLSDTVALRHMACEVRDRLLDAAHVGVPRDQLPM